MAQNNSIKESGKINNGSGSENNNGSQRKPAVKRKRIIIPFIIILLAVSVAVYWYISQLGFVSTDDAYIDSNIVGFTNILEGCRHHDVEHLVYASSSSVYGSNTNMPFSKCGGVEGVGTALIS